MQYAGNLGALLSFFLSFAVPYPARVFVFCAKVWDVREARRSMVSQAAAHGADVNVLAWNPSVAYLLASGADDGCFKVRPPLLPFSRRSRKRSRVGGHSVSLLSRCWIAKRFDGRKNVERCTFALRPQVWDLRAFGKGPASSPVANFRWHTQPVTSLEWHPTDESVLAVSSDDDSVTVNHSIDKTSPSTPTCIAFLKPISFMSS